MKDNELLQGIKNSDLESFKLFMDKYMNYLYGVVNRVGANKLQEEDKEEVIANVWIKVWKKREELVIEEGKEKLYIGVMCRNEAISCMRRQGLIEEVPLEEDHIANYGGEEVEQQVVQEEEKQIIKEVVDSLPEPDREIFIRRYFYFEKVKDIAAAMGMNSKTIATKLFRGKERLGQLLRERGIRG